ncbi:MAG: hypothetical protein KAV87_13835 [Desulfobacteraceae bacterium]|nr:hypothetical protein [Desulfobacteraceae bacterium]
MMVSRRYWIMFFCSNPASAERTKGRLGLNPPVPSAGGRISVCPTARRPAKISRKMIPPKPALIRGWAKYHYIL